MSSPFWRLLLVAAVVCLAVTECYPGRKSYSHGENDEDDGNVHPHGPVGHGEDDGEQQSEDGTMNEEERGGRGGRERGKGGGGGPESGNGNGGGRGGPGGNGGGRGGPGGHGGGRGGPGGHGGGRGGPGGHGGPGGREGPHRGPPGHGPGHGEHGGGSSGSDRNSDMQEQGMGEDEEDSHTSQHTGFGHSQKAKMQGLTFTD